MTTPTTIPAIERRFRLAAPPERVWRALTDAAEVGSWFCQRASIPAEIGADGWMEWDEHGRFAIRIERFEPPHHFAWIGARDPDTAIDDGPTTLVEWWLEPAAGGGTHVRLRESGFAAPEDRRLNALGWLHSFGAIAKHVADEPWQAGIVRTDSFAAAADRIWAALTTREGLAPWWGELEFEVAAGAEGWFTPTGSGRHAMRFDAIEQPGYVAWTWTTEPDVTVGAARQLLQTEWVVMPRDDGGADLHLFESGFLDPDEHRGNQEGWAVVTAELRKALDG